MRRPGRDRVRLDSFGMALGRRGGPRRRSRSFEARRAKGRAMTWPGGVGAVLAVGGLLDVAPRTPFDDALRRRVGDTVLLGERVRRLAGGVPCSQVADDLVGEAAVGVVRSPAQR